jgi:signal transduction histidine kinase
MRSMDTGLSIWKLTGALLTLSAGTSIAIYVPVAQWTQTSGLDARIGVLPFALIVLIIQGYLVLSLTRRLDQIAIALGFLSRSEPVSEIPITPSDLLKPLVDPVNALIRERVDLRTMRGRLVDQISAAAAQEERNRLARDLHDSIKQQVFSMSISAAAAFAHLDSNRDAARAALIDVRQSAQEAMVEMRALLQQLSPAPLEKVGLVEALRDQCEALAYRTGAQVETQFAALPPDDRLPTGAGEAIFRIAQEALSNIARHARAHQVTLRLDSADALILTIQDDGQGFDPDAPAAGMGMSNMRARAEQVGGALTVDSRPGHGTSLTLRIPLVQSEKGDMPMQAVYEAQIPPITSRYMIAGGTAAGFILSFSMLVWRLRARPDITFDDPILIVILAGLLVTVIVSAPIAAWSWLRAERARAALTIAAGHDSSAVNRVLRQRHLAFLIVGVASAWFLPILSLGFDVHPWTPVGIGIAGLGFTLWHYWRMYLLYRAEVMAMSPAWRIEEMRKRIKEINAGWLTTGFLLFILSLNLLLGVEIMIPPQEPDHWMNVAFFTVSAALLGNQVLSLTTYRRWLNAAGLEAGE